LLSLDETARAARFRFERDRVRWTRARSVLRLVLRRYTAAEQFTYGKFGKPALPGIEFNLSHAEEFAVVAVTARTPVGVDIERIRPEVEIAKLLARLGERDLPESREELFQRWTRREAMSKAVGGELFVPPPQGIGVATVCAPAGYVASVALVGFEPECRFQDFETLDNLSV
jgi:4'-phosphopantetheinyl transferase